MGNIIIYLYNYLNLFYFNLLRAKWQHLLHTSTSQTEFLKLEQQEGKSLLELSLLTCALELMYTKRTGSQPLKPLKSSGSLKTTSQVRNRCTQDFIMTHLTNQLTFRTESTPSTASTSIG